MKVLGIIPARGGSKGVANKNIRKIAGEPLINYAIKSALASSKLEKFIVSTDSDQIRKIAEENNAPVLMRPKELALDSTPIVPVLLHCLDHCKRVYSEEYDLVLLLQPTSPIRTGLDIDNVINMFAAESKLDAVISVVPMNDVHPARMYEVDEGGWMHSLSTKWEEAQRQELKPVYYRNGCIYAIRTTVLVEKKTLMVKNKKAYIMSLEHLANIDDERDFIITGVLVDLWKQGKL